MIKSPIVILTDVINDSKKTSDTVQDNGMCCEIQTKNFSSSRMLMRTT